MLKLNFSFVKEFRSNSFSTIRIFLYSLFGLSDIREILVAGALRRGKVFSDEFFHGHEKGVNVGTFKFEATISREPKM